MGILSDNINEVGQNLKQFIKQNTVPHKNADEGMKYYDGQNDVLNNRIFWVDENGRLKEDKNAANIKIPHQFMTEIVDQKVQFLLSNGIEAKADEENQDLQPLLDEYYDEDFKQSIEDLITNASQKGFEYLYAQADQDGKVQFIVADGLKIYPVTDNMGNVIKILRVWQEDIKIDNRTVHLSHAELYDQETVTYFLSTNNSDYVLDLSIKPNPRPHVINVQQNGNDVTQTARGLGKIPFYRFQNNVKEKTDLEPIKAMVDDYDMMNAFMSNNLQDMADAIYVFRGESDMDASEMRMNIKAKKGIITGDEGDFDMKTYTIPVEGRKTKMEIDRQNIYKFGMGVDSLQVGDGNITNVVIMSRYELLNMKVNKLETRVRALLKWVNELVISDINRINGTSYLPSAVDFDFERKMLINEKDNADTKKTEADTVSVQMQTLLSLAPYLDKETVLRQITDKFDLDFEEVAGRMETQDYANNGAEID